MSRKLVRSSRYQVVSALMMIAFLYAGPAMGQVATLTLHNALIPGTEIGKMTLEVTSYVAGPPTLSNPASGTGKLRMYLQRDPHTISTVGFEKLTVDKNGAVTGYTITLTDDYTPDDFLDAGLDDLKLTLRSGTKITVTGTPKETPPSDIKITGRARLTFPFKTSSGSQASLELPNNTIEYKDKKLTVSLKGIDLSPLTGGLWLGPFVLNAAAADFDLTWPRTSADPTAKSYALTLKVPSAAVKTSLPSLSSQDPTPLALHVTNLQLDENGDLTFDKATLDGPQTVQLLQPLDFALSITAVNVSVVHGHFNSFGITADLILPPDVRNSDDAAGARVVIKGIQADISKGFVLSIAQPLDIYWNSFALHSKGAVVVDLSAGIGVKKPGTDTAWTGIYLESATLDLPKGLSSASGRATVSVKDFYFDTLGISGSVTLTPDAIPGLKLMGFPCKASSGTVSLEESAVKLFSISGQITVPEWGELGVKIGFSTAGLISAEVDPSTPLSLHKFGLAVALSSACLKHQPDGRFVLLVSGALSFPEIAAFGDAAIQVTDLSIDSDGKVSLPTGEWLTLPHPARLSLGVCTVEATQIGFGTDEKNGKWIGLTGGVKLGDDLPVTGHVDFEGLKVYEGPKLTVGGIHFMGSVMNLATIEGGLTEKLDDAGNRYLYGDAKLALNMAAGVIEGDVHFLVGKNAWFLIGNVELPVTTPVVLGQTGLGLFGFRGGLGHNVVSVPPNATGIPGKDYQLKPDPESKNGWLFVAGVKIGTIEDPSVAWGDVTLTVTFPELSVDLNGQFWFLEDQSPTPKGDRTATADISYFSRTKALRGVFSADLNFPDKKTRLYALSGTIDMLLSPKTQYFRVGWPLATAAATVTLFDGKFPPIKGGFTVELKKEKKIQAALLWEGDFFKVIKGKVEGTLDITLDKTAGMTAAGTLLVDGSVDVSAFVFQTHALLAATLDTNRFDFVGDVTGTIRVGIKPFQTHVDFKGHIHGVIKP